MARRAAVQSPQRTTAQNARLHGLVAKLVGLGSILDEIHIPDSVRRGEGDMSRKWLAAAALHVSGQKSSSSLNIQQANQAITWLEAETSRLIDVAKNGSTTPTRGARSEELITRDQADLIGKLTDAIAWLKGEFGGMAADRQKMMKWCKHFLGTPWPQSQRDADVAIEALKSILTRELPAADVLEGELAECQRRADELVPFGQRLIADAGRRAKWGPYQWFKLHQVHQQLRGEK